MVSLRQYPMVFRLRSRLGKRIRRQTRCRVLTDTLKSSAEIGTQLSQQRRMRRRNAVRSIF